MDRERMLKWQAKQERDTNIRHVVITIIAVFIGVILGYFLKGR